MNRRPLSALCLVLASLTAARLPAEETFGWRDKNGNAAPDTPSRKSANGFAGWLLTTSDEDWEAKWNTPEHVTPQFKGADKIRTGGKVYTLIFVVNPKPDARGVVEVRCDIRMTRPDGTVSLEQKDQVCLEGRLEGSPYNMRLSPAVLGFVGEASDPVGTWTVDVTLRDIPRGASMDLRATFEYLADAK